MEQPRDFSITAIDRERYRPTEEAQEILETLRTSLVPGEKYLVARLAIARSLYEPQQPTMLGKGTEFANSIEGTHLFGDDTALWASLIVEAAREPVTGPDVLKKLIEAHWHRGALLLKRDLEETGGRTLDFAVQLALLAGPASARTDGAFASSAATAGGRVTFRPGEVGLDFRTNSVVEIELNGPGTAPHFAIMGKTRSGKTRTGLAIAEQIAHQTSLPLVFIDPKGEFVNDGRFVQLQDGRTLADIFPGAEPLDVSKNPVPLDFLRLPKGASESEIAEAAISFRDSFAKCIANRGSIAMDDLREVVADLLRHRRDSLSVADIRDAVRQANEQSGRGKDSIEAKLNELTAVPLFEPRLSPEEFFRKRWVIALNPRMEEATRLVIFLVLDALARSLLSLEDSASTNSYRHLRHLLVVDEARDVLRYRHGALSQLVRKSAAKGGVVMLLSQGPDDFDQAEDDFLQQVGTTMVFASNATSLKNLRGVFGRPIRPEDVSEKTLTRGIALAKLPHRESARVLAWK